VRKVEIERARRKRPDSLDAYDLYLRALPRATTCMPEDVDSALPLLEKAIELEPDYAAAHGMIAWCHEQRYLRGGLREETRAAASKHARAAIAMGGDDAAALGLGGFVVGVVEHDFTSALIAIDRSLALSPSSALNYAFSAIIRAWKGDDADAVAHAETAFRHSPYDPLIWMPYIGLAYTHFFSRRFEDALSAAVQALRGNPHFSVPAYLQTASLARLGRDTEAVAAGGYLLRTTARLCDRFARR
jgi:tetratricopeptide (TPR) repeat protein